MQVSPQKAITIMLCHFEPRLQQPKRVKQHIQHQWCTHVHVGNSKMDIPKSYVTFAQAMAKQSTTPAAFRIAHHQLLGWVLKDSDEACTRMMYQYVDMWVYN